MHGTSRNTLLGTFKSALRSSLSVLHPKIFGNVFLSPFSLEQGNIFHMGFISKSVTPLKVTCRYNILCIIVCYKFEIRNYVTITIAIYSNDNDDFPVHIHILFKLNSSRIINLKPLIANFVDLLAAELSNTLVNLTLGVDSTLLLCNVKLYN